MNRTLRIATLAALLVVTSTAFAANHDVPGDFATIAAAIADAGTVDGDSITIAPIVHVEDTIHITKELTIRGQGPGSTEVVCTAGDKIAFYVDADNVTLEEMTIRDCSQAIRFEMAAGTIDSTTIRTVEMRDNSSRGIEVHNATTVTNLLVDDCEFTETGHGLRVSSSGHIDGADFIDSLFDGNKIGIYEANGGGTSTMKDVEIRDCIFRNHIAGQATAIFLEEIQDALIVDNLFIDNSRDFQIFKWYQPSVKVSNVVMTGNLHLGTSSRGVFTLFNAENQGGQTEFDGILYAGNTAITADGTGVFAGGHISDTDLGGIGWETVHVNCNSFLNIQTAGQGVRYFNTGVPVGEELGGATLDTEFNYWGTDKLAPTLALMEIPAITDFVPFLTAPPSTLCPEVGLEVTLESFTATATERGVLLRWTTTSEIDNAGFRIARARVKSKRSGYEVISEGIIPARGSQLEGARYSFLDPAKSVEGQVFYFLEDIDFDGQVTRHGPVTVESSRGELRVHRKR